MHGYRTGKLHLILVSKLAETMTVNRCHPGSLAMNRNGNANGGSLQRECDQEEGNNFLD